MEFDRFRQVAKVLPEDITQFAKEMAAGIEKILVERQDLHDRYIRQSGYKPGVKVAILHRKHGWLKGKIDKIRVNEINGEYEFSFRVHGKIIPTGHVLSMRPR